MGRFDNKVALVTGGGAGIGRAAALAFAREGAAVMIGDVSAEGEAVLHEIRAAGGVGRFMRCDVSEASDVEALVSAAVSSFGGLDVAFNNAGVEGARGPVEGYSLEAWNHVLAVNLTGVFLCMRAEIPLLRTRGGGAIVNNASILGEVAFAGAPAYTAAKHGVIGLTKAAALENAPHGVRVNALCPAFIETPMLARAGLTNDPASRAAVEALHPVGRLGRSEEVAAAALWLASPEASFVTGTAMRVDGGYLAR